MTTPLTDPSGPTAGPTTGPAPVPPPLSKRLTRSSHDKWLGGICGGLAEYTGVDANVIRLLAVLGTVLGAGSLIVVYLVAWVLVPVA